jgi:hypothetical protein
VKLSADSTALIMGGTTVPTPDEFWIESVMNQFIAPTHPTHPGQTITPVAVTTPEEIWPITGIARLLELAFGDPSIAGPGGPAWPDEPWWKLSGLFDLTGDQSIQAGVADLKAAMAAHGNDHLVIYGYSQGAVVANMEKKRLAEQYPDGTTAPDINFVLGADENLPNGGLLARFAGLYIPILDWTFNGPAPTDTQFKTVEINQQYDGFADFPLYPLNLISTLNAVLGIVYLHTNPFDVSLPAHPTTSPAYQGTHGDTSYYFFQTQDLPLFAPLRQLGAPEALIDVVEPFFRVLVDLGYDRSIGPWEPTPARLIPTLDPGKVTADLVNAIDEGISNALALVGSPPLSSPAPVTRAAPVTATDTLTRTEQMTSAKSATGTRQKSTDMPPSTTKVTETNHADVSRQVTATGTVTETGHLTSAEKVVETAKANGTPAGPTAASARRLSAGASASEPRRPRPVVRRSPEMGEQLRDRPHRGDGGHPAALTAAASDRDATAGPASVDAG